MIAGLYRSARTRPMRMQRTRLPRGYVQHLCQLACVSAVVLGMGGAIAPLAAQSKVEIVLPPRDSLATQHPVIRTGDVITPKHTAELINNGFPARLHYKLELWAASQISNAIRSRTEWETIVEYDKLGEQYRVIRALPDRAVIIGEYKTLDSAAAKVAEPFRPTIGLPRKGERSYYTVTMTVETMSLSDLDEVRRWLRGELRPAVRGRRNPGSAVTSGLRRLLTKVLGGERVSYDASTGVFRAPN